MKKQLTLIIPLLLFSLTGCTGLMIATGLIVSGAIVYDKRSIKTMHEDQSIRYTVLSRLAADPAFANSHIKVASFNYTVLLVGQTATAELKRQAGELTKNVPNLDRAYNQLTVGTPTSKETRHHDAWITAQVRSKLLGKSGLASGSIKVVTENSVVYLMGNVTRVQADLAADAARQVKDVEKVVKVFQLK